ncbi:VWA domain-containing protein [Brevibacillus sp. SYP-B805]|uniref:vWA domain-containing protein n=1 Tax=Brevibacillus sp. SYP-B805 TaxID=1578199 RepID=UPI0013ED2A38|nr:VWA domain-containing protein [Brevibacillus sp. SYP-B805]NGQ97046.1 VWA domain-containing protein [Brevibacillus sp. SYP-B805]
MKIIQTLLLAFLLMILILLNACSNEEEPSKEQAREKPAEAVQTPAAPTQAPAAQEPSREEKIKALKALIPPGVAKRPETAEEFAAFPPGRFANLRYVDHEEEILPILQQFPKVEQPDQEILDLYYLALLGLFAEDYPDPQQLMDEIKMASFGDPNIEDPRFQFKERYNVEIILDASGSMAEKMDGKTRMEAAKEAIREFAASLPKEAHVALRVYGHKGSGKESDKALSCGSSELVYGMQPYDAQKLQNALDRFQPTGYTPIAYSLQEALKDFTGLSGDKNNNMIYLVSDGIETCDGNPVEAGKQLAKSNIAPIVNVIGFGVDGEGQRQLKEVAQAAGGRYLLIRNQNELKKEFQQAREIAYKWSQWRRHASFVETLNRNKRMMDIHAYHYDWVTAAREEKYNLFFVIRALGNRDILSKDAEKALNDIREKQFDVAYKRGDELESFLRSLTEKSYKEAIDEINKKYGEHVTGN